MGNGKKLIINIPNKPIIGPIYPEGSNYMKKMKTTMETTDLEQKIWEKVPVDKKVEVVFPLVH